MSQFIDLEHLSQYSIDKLLEIAKELQHVILEYQSNTGIFGSPSPTCDIDAQESYYNQMDNRLEKIEYYQKILDQINTELSNRITTNIIANLKRKKY